MRKDKRYRPAISTDVFPKAILYFDQSTENMIKGTVRQLEEYVFRILWEDGIDSRIDKVSINKAEVRYFVKIPITCKHREK
jgi:hypothetical protein